MAENRRGVHILANRAGLSYRDTKHLLFEIMLDTPQAASAARTLAMAIKRKEISTLSSLIWYNRMVETGEAFRLSA